MARRQSRTLLSRSGWDGEPRPALCRTSCTDVQSMTLLWSGRSIQTAPRNSDRRSAELEQAVVHSVQIGDVVTA